MSSASRGQIIKQPYKMGHCEVKQTLTVGPPVSGYYDGAHTIAELSDERFMSDWCRLH